MRIGHGDLFYSGQFTFINSVDETDKTNTALLPNAVPQLPSPPWYT